MAQVRPLSRDSRCLSRDSGFEEFDFLLPNGFMVTMACDRRSSLSEVKTALWERAVQLPASNHLRDSRHYVFVGVNPSAVEEEYTDDQTIQEIQPVRNILEVSMPRFAREMMELNQRIPYKISRCVCISCGKPTLKPDPVVL